MSVVIYGEIEWKRERERVIKFIFFCKKEFPSLWMRPPFTN